MDELASRSAADWESLRINDVWQWARDRRRYLFDSPTVSDPPGILERALEAEVEEVRVETVAAFGQYREQAKRWGRNHLRARDAFERYEALLQKFYAASSLADDDPVELARWQAKRRQGAAYQRAWKEELAHRRLVHPEVALGDDYWRRFPRG